MLVVLHSKLDVSPITALDMPIAAYRELLKSGTVVLKLNETNNKIFVEKVPINVEVNDSVEEIGEIFLAWPEEAALLLAPTLLPGQSILNYTIKKA